MIGIVSDHRGYKLKKQIVDKMGSKVIDYGTYDEQPIDYPDYAKIIADKVLNHEVDFGIAICGTGIGMSIACNKIVGIRCAKIDNLEDAILSRQHNNANVMALSSKNELNDSIALITSFASTKFSQEERHLRRIEKINFLEKNK